MTHRTEAPQPTQVEIAVRQIETDLPLLIANAHRLHNVQAAQHIDSAEFLRIVALYLADKTTENWCKTLGVPTPQHIRDRGDRI